MATLIENNGQHAGRKHRILRREYVLGRHPECDIVVEAGAVSRHHARVLRDGTTFFIEDLQSRNGTYVNEELVYGKRALSEGDQIRVCDISFTFNSNDVTPVTRTGGVTVLMEDGEYAQSSTIMSKLDISSDEGVRFSASSDVKLQALLEITKSLGRSLSLDQVLPQVLNSLFKIFLQADRGFIVLREQNKLIAKWTKLRRETTDTIRISKTIVNHVIDSKQAIVSEDAATDKRFDMSESIAEFRIRSMICAPLVNVDGVAIGAIQIDTIDQRKRFKAEDLEVLSSVATQAAIAIDNAQLHERALAQRELERDLQLAREVQNGFLPKSVPNCSCYLFYDYYKPANHVGGDYYDYIGLPDGKWAVVVADVVGHGIAASLLMSKLSASVKFALASNEDPARAMEQLNQTLAADQLEDRFITLVLAILDPQANAATFVAAGHMPPLIRRADNQVTRFAIRDHVGPAILLDDDLTFESHTVPFNVGDTMVLFTDGITEATDPDFQLYGEERMIALLKANQTNDPTIVGRAIVEDVRKFTNGIPNRDDMCLVCISRC
ncbi:MAG: SpoIIE family protein phosphatase [Planctomycetales bacterium]|nr:SpoIIE family protein phosphatase [Planctomycetales bacterium]